ncbi:hypothetical protein BH09PSE3_BH09PSE3_07780 [soil metagenome]
MKSEADLLVKYAEREAVRSRAQFLSTIAEIRYRIDPRVIAAEAAENMLGRANQLLSDTTTSVKNRPLLSFGSLAAFAVAVGLRIWLAKGKANSDAT